MLGGAICQVFNPSKKYVYFRKLHIYRLVYNVRTAMGQLYSTTQGREQLEHGSLSWYQERAKLHH